MLQLINKRGGGAFSAQGRGGGRGAGEDPRHRLLQPAPRRAQQQALEVRRPRRQGPRLREGPREGDRDRARQPARRRQDPDRGAQDPQGGDPAGARASSTTAPPGSPRGALDPRGPQAARLRRLPEEERVRAARAARGHGAGGGRGPLRPHPPRRDQGDEPRAALRVPGGPARRHPRLRAARATARPGPVVEEADLGRIINDLGTGEEGEVEGEAEETASPRSTRPTAASSSSATRSSSTPTTRAPPTSTSSPTARRRPPSCASASTATARSTSRSRPPTATPSSSASRSWPSSTSPRSGKPQDGKIRFRGPMGTIELRVATIPTSGGNEDVVMRILAASQAAAAREDGLPRSATSREFKTILAEALRHLPRGGPDRLGQDDHPALRRSASSTPRT